MLFDFWRHKYNRCGPREKVRIAVMYQVASYWPSIESFYRACVNDDSVDIRIFFVNEVSVESAQIEKTDVFLTEKGIPFFVYSEKELKNFHPHAALYQPPYDVSYRNPSALSVHLREMGIRIVYIPYGIEISDTEDARFNHFHTFVVRNAWRIYTFSEIMLEDYKKYCPNRQAVRAFGIPKFDSIVHRNEMGSSDHFQMAGGRRIILWKMHFPKLIYDNNQKKQVTPYIEEYLRFAGQIEDYDDLFFVVMPHPMFFSQTISPELSKKTEKLFWQLRGKKNVYIDDRADYRISLYHADAVIIDRSAVMVEAGFLDIPVLYMKNPDYEEPLTKAVKELADSYEQGTSCADIQKFLDKFCDQELGPVIGRIKKARLQVLPPEAGMSGEKILADIKGGIRNPEKKKINISFFGASFICRHYIEKLMIKNNADFKIVCLSDNDSKKWGSEQEGIEIVAPEKMKEKEIDLIVITSEQYYMPIKRQLVYELHMDEEKILRLDYFAEMYMKDYMQNAGYEDI